MVAPVVAVAGRQAHKVAKKSGVYKWLAAFVLVGAVFVGVIIHSIVSSVADTTRAGIQAIAATQMVSGELGVCASGPGPAVAASAAKAAGFTGEDLVTAVAVAGAESGYNRRAYNDKNTDGSIDYGLWQINSVHADLLAKGGNWWEPVANARMAHVLWKANHGWSPWVAYNSGAYRVHLGEARAAVNAGGPTVCGGDTFTDPALGGWPRSNPRTVVEAEAWARHAVTAVTYGTGSCMAFVADAYGWAGSGITDYGSVYAIDNYRQLPDAYKHPGSRDPPPGALVFWLTGNPAGHVAIYLGSGMVASTDISRPGRVDVVPFSTVERRWHATYVGWTPPYFPNAV